MRSCFYFLGVFSCLCTCFSCIFPYVFFIPLILVNVLSCSAWPVLRGDLAALCLVSQLSVWSRGALLRRLSQCRSSLRVCELVCIIARVLHLVSHVPLPLRSKHRGTLRLSVIDLAPRGGDGMVASAEVLAESFASSASSDRPSTLAAHRCPPEDSSRGSHERRNLFQDISPTR